MSEEKALTDSIEFPMPEGDAAKTIMFLLHRMYSLEVGLLRLRRALRRAEIQTAEPDVEQVRDAHRHVIESLRERWFADYDPDLPIH